MGGLREHDRKRLCFFVDKGNADNFFQQLRQLSCNTSNLHIIV